MMILNRKLRKRAFSECTKIRQTKKTLHGFITITRPQSDSDLSCIDREKTFALQSQQQVEPGELLAKLSVALSEYRNGYPNHVGFSGFSDSEILADETNYSNMSIATSTDRYPPSETYARSRRALSEVCIPIERYVKVISMFLISHIMTSTWKKERHCSIIIFMANKLIFECLNHTLGFK